MKTTEMKLLGATVISLSLLASASAQTNQAGPPQSRIRGQSRSREAARSPLGTKREKTAEMKMLFLALALTMSISLTACGTDNGAVGSAPPKQPNEVSNEQGGRMKIRIKVGDKEATATLNDSPIARDFASMLPLTLTLEDFNKNEKIGYPPRRLTTEGASGDSDAGDVAYYAPWGNLAIFYKDIPHGSGNGLIILGKIDSNKEIFNVPGSLKVTIELVK